MTEPAWIPPSRRARRTPPTWVWIAVVVAAVAAGAGVTFALVHKSAPATFTVHGTLTTSDGSGYPPEDAGKPCGQNGIAGGAQVVIYDGTDRSVAVGALDTGTVAEDAGGNLNTCRFTFAVANVPAGTGPYSVEVAQRGKVVFTEAQAGAVALSLS